jgi:hypothetical protein
MIVGSFSLLNIIGGTIWDDPSTSFQNGDGATPFTVWVVNGNSRQWCQARNVLINARRISEASTSHNDCRAREMAWKVEDARNSMRLTKTTKQIVKQPNAPKRGTSSGLLVLSVIYPLSPSDISTAKSCVCAALPPSDQDPRIMPGSGSHY